MEKVSVTRIEPKAKKVLEGTTTPFAKRRVCGYARVSTDSDEQATSYESQVEYYTNYIKQNPQWEFVGLYSDEGVTGTSTKKRDGFNNMVSDALAGKIDLILTKSVSRFARNTVDALVTIRKLKEKNVEVFFEKENCYTLDGKGEFLIGLLSSLSQEESRSISQNTIWGKRKGFENGKFNLAYSTFLGYDKGDGGRLVVNKEEAKTIRLIYKLFLMGNGLRKIKKELERLKIKTPMGKDKWHVTTIASQLRNEKYVGDLLMQKYYCTDFLTKKQKANDGELPKFFVKDDHEAIVDRRTFDIVQEELKNRNRLACSDYNGKIICADCGAVFTRKIWHSSDKYKTVIYSCKNKYTKGCKNTHIREVDIKAKFVEALAVLLEKKYDVIENVKLIKETVCDTRLDEEKKAKLEQELKTLDEKANALVSENARKPQDQKSYQEQYDALSSKFEKAKDSLNKILTSIEEKKSKAIQIDTYIETLTKLKVAKWDPTLWLSLVDKMLVGKYKTEIIFKDGERM